MRTLPPSASTFRYVTHARYVAHSLAVAGRREQSQRIRAAADKLRDLDRAVEDQAVLVFELKADRDFADRKGDVVIRDFRHGINARSRDAIKQPPATRIFPDGVEYYTAAPISEQAERYAELEGRIMAHLPEDDPLRAPTLAGLSDALTAFLAAEGVLRSERRTLSELRLDLRDAREDLIRMLERTWGALVAELGKDAADGFFPVADSGDDEKDEGEGTTAPV